MWLFLEVTHEVLEIGLDGCPSDHWGIGANAGTIQFHKKRKSKKNPSIRGNKLGFSLTTYIAQVGCFTFCLEYFTSAEKVVTLATPTNKIFKT